jgi:RTA1 like protein
VNLLLLAIGDPNNSWVYCPSPAASILFATLYGITTTLHIIQATKYHKKICSILIMGGIWETAAYIIRCISIQHPASKGAFDSQFILILLAPLWINAFDYVLLGQMAHFFLLDKKLWGMRAERMGLYFVLLDIS